MPFVKTFPFYDDHTVNDEIVGPSDGSEVDVPHDVATDC